MKHTTLDVVQFWCVGIQAAASELTSEELFRATQLFLQANVKNIPIHSQSWSNNLTISHSRSSFIFSNFVVAFYEPRLLAKQAIIIVSMKKLHHFLLHLRPYDLFWSSSMAAWRSVLRLCPRYLRLRSDPVASVFHLFLPSVAGCPYLLRYWPVWPREGLLSHQSKVVSNIWHQQHSVIDQLFFFFWNIWFVCLYLNTFCSQSCRGRRRNHCGGLWWQQRRLWGHATWKFTTQLVQSIWPDLVGIRVFV